MLTRYTLLFDIQMRHRYYQSGDGKDLKVLPTTACQKLLQQYGLLFKSQNSGGIVLCKEEEDESIRPTLIKHLDSPLILEFVIKNQNPLFFNFTDLPFPDSQSHYVFNNLEATSTDDGLLLSKESQVSAADLVTGPVPFENCLGLLQIQLDPQNKAAGAFLQDGKILHQKYILSFANRSTIWRYYVLGNKDYEFSDFEVSDHSTPMEFSEAEEKVTLSNGQQATLLTAAKALPLEEKRATFFKLKVSKKKIEENGFTSPHSINLPNADPQQIKPEMQGDQRVIYSDIYLYL